MTIKLEAKDIVPGNHVRPGGEHAPPYEVVDTAIRHSEYGDDTFVVTMRYTENAGTFDVHYEPDEDVYVSSIRRAKIETRSREDVKEVLKYLPSNYGLWFVEECYALGDFKIVDDVAGLDHDCPVSVVYIQGFDSCGWTLEDYVIPRLASGMYGCRELTEAEEEDLAEMGVLV